MIVYFDVHMGVTPCYITKTIELEKTGANTALHQKNNNNTILKNRIYLDFLLILNPFLTLNSYST